MAVKLKTGTASQVFYAWVRKTAGAPNPAETMYLYENGANVATVLSNVAITSTTGQLLIGTWDAALLSDSTGAGVECRLASTGNATNTVEVGAVGWLANYSIDDTTTLNLAASNLADQQPVLGQPVMGVKRNLVASSLADRAPLVGQPTIGQKHALAAANLADRAPLPGQPVAGQKHVLTSTALSDRQPLLAQPVMGVKRNLAASGLANLQPITGQPGVGQKHALTATALADRQPVFAQPTLGVVRNLAASGLADRQPLLGQPVLGVIRNLATSSLADRQPLPGQPVIGQRHVLTATALAGRQPVLGQPIPASAGQFTPLPLVDRQPLLGTPAVGQEQVLAAAALADRQPLLATPTVGQGHALAATALADRQPLVDQPTMAVTRNLAATSLADLAPFVEQPAVGQEHALAATALASAAPTITHPALGQEGSLAADEVEGLAPLLAAPTVGQEHVLAADVLATTAPVLEQAAAAQDHHLAATGLASGAALLDPASLTIGIFGLAANDLGSAAGILEQAGVGQEHALAAADQDAAEPVLDAPPIESFLPGVFIADDLDAAAAFLGQPKVNWREIGVIKFTAANTQAKVDTVGARPAYASAGAGVSSTAQLGALGPLAPADAQPGDLLIWVAAAIDVDCNVTPPAGYAQLPGSPFGASTASYAPRLHIALKTADGSEAGNPQGFNYALTSGDAAARSISARVFRITAADGFAASHVEGVAFSEGIIADDAAVHCPPVAPAGVNRLGLIATVVNSAAGDASSAGGIWQQAVPEYQSTTGGDCTLDLQWAALAREPSTGAQIPYGATGDAWVSAGFALAPPRTSIDVASAGVLIEDLPPVLAKAVNM